MAAKQSSSSRGVDRRSLLKGALALPLAGSLPALFARAVAAAERSDRVLVLLQLAGGNDGLNMVVPYGHDAYYRARPALGVAAKSVVPLSEEIGLNPALSGLRRVWDKGALAVVQGVGYPNHSRSHFTSTDIWQSAECGACSRRTGWLGRALDRSGHGEVPALELDAGPLSLALVGESTRAPCVSDAARFRVRGGAAALHRLQALAAEKRESAHAAFVANSARQAYETSKLLEKALAKEDSAGGYPQTSLAHGLWQIARLVAEGFPTRIYALSLSGFDTHSQQRAGHDALLKMIGDALGAFHDDLYALGLDKRVLLLTYSEFGRRVQENRSLGTDHGAAAPLLVMGGAISGGLKGKHPSLTDLYQGDLKFHTDFRQVYATVLDRWLNADAHAVLRGNFPPIPFL